MTDDCWNNPHFKTFIQSVNDSYIAFERDKNLTERSFKESKKKCHQINESLKEEYELKKQLIANLYDNIEATEDSFEGIGPSDNVDDLLFISKYLNQQIEKRKLTEKNLSRNVELLKTLLVNLQFGVLFEDETRKILFTNKMFCDMFHISVSPEAMAGNDCSNSAEQTKHLFKDPESFSLRINEILARKEMVFNELLETIEGRCLERDFIPIFIEGEYKGHLWKYADVTERIQNQNLLQQSEERSRFIMNASMNAIITADTEMKITFWNHKAEVLFGWKKEEVLGKMLTEVIISEEQIKEYEDYIKKYFNVPTSSKLDKQIELYAINKEGVEFPVELSVIELQLNSEVSFCASIQDISKRKKAEFNLKIQEEKYRNILSNMNLGVIEVDNDEVIKFANQSFAFMSGYETDELIGKMPSELFISGENVKITKEKMNLRKLGISDVYQLAVKNKNGELKWWAVSGAPNYDDRGFLVGSIGIHLDITDQKQLESDLEKEKIKAQQASKAKEVFLATMSHEIRTPLNAIIGFLRELSKQELTDLQRKYIKNSSIASKHLLAIINNILDISKIESGEISLEKENFIFENTLNNVIKVLKPTAKQKGLKLSTSISTRIAPVFLGDALRLEQIFFNLVGNAIKFTDKGKIIIRCEVIKDSKGYQKLHISIADTGIGMDKEYIKNIFRKFSQENRDIARKFGGTGLGMTITKELIQLMRGKIQIESEKGEGTTFHVIISLPKGSQQELKSVPPVSDINIEGITVLLVEDNELNRMVARTSLENFHCNVTEAENGIKALEILKVHKFDIILMDIQMPELDGLEVTNSIRKELKLLTPIIALTANAFKSEIEECRAAGMDDYITKPFDEITLLELIAQHTVHKKENNHSLEKSFLKEKLYDLNAINSLSRGNNE
ncbi:MAG TPA: PAS domain S-box protein, partial [Flavobacterium sp.]